MTEMPERNDRDAPIAAFASASSSTAVPPGTCLIHGSYSGSACPTCSTGGSIPLQQSVGIPFDPNADRRRLIAEARTYAGNVRSRAARSPESIARLIEELATELERTL